MARMGEEIPRCQQSHIHPSLACITLSLVEMPKVSQDSSPHSYNSTLHSASQGEGLPGAVLYAYFRTIWQGV
jgi:hypothetical protein